MRGKMSSNLNPVDQDSRTWGMLAHLSTFAGYVVPCGNIIGPLVILLTKKDQMPFVEKHAKEALNFQLSVFIYTIFSVMLACIFVGIFTMIAVLICSLIFPIIAAVKANEGVMYRYPLSIRFIS
jgi:uncharacterized Tic20 family protein